MAPYPTERAAAPRAHSDAIAGLRSAKPIPGRHSADLSSGGSRSDRYPRILDMLELRDRESLLSLATEKQVRKGQFLYHQGDTSNALFIIQNGTVKVLYINNKGSALTALYYREGMVVGAHGCTAWSGHHSWTAQALTDCCVLRIRRTDFLDFVKKSAQAMYCVLAITEFKGEHLKQVIRILAQPTLKERILMAVRQLANLYGLPRRDEIEIEVRITHQEIADMVGASRQSVTTLLIALEKAGDIRRDGRHLFVPAHTGDG